MGAVIKLNAAMKELVDEEGYIEKLKDELESYPKYSRKYRPSFGKIARKATASGLNMRELAEVLNVPLHRIYRWMDRYPAFRKAIEDGREAFASGRVEGALLKRALGYDTVETREVKDEEGKLVATIETIKHIPPDPRAIMFYLKNRSPRRWAETRHVHTTRVDYAAILEAAIRRKRK